MTAQGGEPQYIPGAGFVFVQLASVMPSLNLWTFAFLVINILALALCVILIYLFACLIKAERPE